DILVVAVGKPGLINADMVKPGVVVIDVGTTRVPDAEAAEGYRIAGDVDFEGVSAVAEAITPVPGGVGPMTITMLLANTLAAARGKSGVEETCSYDLGSVHVGGGGARAALRGRAEPTLCAFRVSDRLA